MLEIWEEREEYDTVAKTCVIPVNFSFRAHSLYIYYLKLC